MDSDKTSEKNIETIRLTLDGDLIEGGSVDYKTLLEVLDGTVGALDGLARSINSKNAINFNVRPPKEKCFEISIDLIEWVGATVPLFDQLNTAQDILKLFLEYIKIKKALKGEELKPSNIQTNENGTTVKNDSGVVVYNDNRTIINQNIVQNIHRDSSIDKKIDKVAKAIEENNKVETISYSVDKQKNHVSVPRAEAEFLRYHEKMEQRPNTVVGYIRKIDNKSYKGTLIMQEDGRDKNVEFELIIKDIKLLDKVVRNLAYAEADKARVVLTGEQVHDSRGKLKKVIVNDVDIPDAKFGI